MMTQQIQQSHLQMKQTEQMKVRNTHMVNL